MHIDYLIRTSSYALTMADKSAPTDGWVILLIRINCFQLMEFLAHMKQ